MTVHIFVSSTWLDLQPERQAVKTALDRMRETKFIGMEYFGSRDETTRQASLDEVDRSQVYVGIFGERYGSGITEAEYRRAREKDWNALPPALLQKLRGAGYVIASGKGSVAIGGNVSGSVITTGSGNCGSGSASKTNRPHREFTSISEVPSLIING